MADTSPTKGFVTDFLNGNTPNEPNVQVIKIQFKPNAIQFQINDGDFVLAGVLSKELKEKYDKNELENFKENAIIQLQEYRLITQQNVKICYISNFQTKAFANGMFGNPTKPQSVSPVPPSNENNNNSNNSNNNNASSGCDNKNYQPISSLNPYQSNWRIKVRVTQKSQMRTYMKDGKENYVFSVNLLDHEGTEIQATMFNDACKKFYTKFEEQSVYFISNARVTVARRKYTYIKNDYAIIINENSEVTRAPNNIMNGSNSNNSNNSMGGNDSDIIMKQVYDFVKISNISNYEAGSFVDICGIAYEVKEMSQIISKKSGKPLNRRNIVLVDDSKKSIELTIWGNMALEYDEKKLENFPVCVLKAARLSEYAGVKQIMCNNKILLNEFDTVKEAKQLHDWWMSNNGENVKFEPLATSANMGGAGGSASVIPRYSVCDVKENNIGLIDTMFGNFGISGNMANTPNAGSKTMSMTNNNQNKGTYFSMIGTITRSFEINRDTGNDIKRLPWYKACTDPNANNAKVTEQNNGKYFCLKTNKEYPNYIARYVMKFAVADSSGTIWLSAFNDAATMILGSECKEVEKNYNLGNLKEVDKVFKSALFKKFIFRVRARSQEYNGEQRVRYDLLSVQPIDYVNESQSLLKKIEELKAIC